MLLWLAEFLAQYHKGFLVCQYLTLRAMLGIATALVLSLWWLIMTTTLSVLLYRGFRLRDDYVYFLPWARPAAPEEPGAGKKAKKGKGFSDGCGVDGCGGLDGCGAADGEGLLALLAVVLRTAGLPNVIREAAADRSERTKPVASSTASGPP